MAVLIPDTPKDCTRSERVVYQRLGAELDKDWVILHSLGLTDHATKRRGEADIVILSTQGIFVLEVKGGHVSCKDGKWYFGTPGENVVEKKEDPWTQASGGMFALIKRINKEAPDLESLIFGFGISAFAASSSFSFFGVNTYFLIVFLILIFFGRINN